MGIAEAACAALALVAPLAADAPGATPATASVVLRWATVRGAGAYDVQIASDPTFASLVVEERVRETSFRWRKTPARAFHWRVRSVDAAGRPGAWSAVRSIAPAVGAPRQRAPADGAHVVAGRVDLSCEPSRLLRSYALEVARDPGFAQRVFEEGGSACAFLVTLREPGRVHWRVRGITADGEATPPSPGRALEVLPAAPELLSPDAGEVVPFSAVPLRWSAVRGAVEYRIGIEAPAGPRAFTVREAEASFTPQAPGVHRWTVTAVGAAGLPGPAAPARALEVNVVAPVPEAPGEGEVLRTATIAPIDLAWSKVPGAAGYDVEIVNRQSGEIVWRAGAREGRARAELGPGAYRWTVAARTESGRSGPPSPPRALSVELLPTPRPGPPADAVAGGAATAALDRADTASRAPSAAPVAAAAPRHADAGTTAGSPLRPRTPAGPPDAGRERGSPLRAGVGAAWRANFGRLSRPGPALEIAARRPFSAGLLGLSLRASWFEASATVPTSDVLPMPVRASAQLFPVALLATFERARGRLSAYGAAGASAWIARVESGGEALARVAPGAEALVGAARRLRSGEAFLEVGGTLGELSTPVLRMRTGGLFVAAGWRVDL